MPYTFLYLIIYATEAIILYQYSNGLLTPRYNMRKQIAALSCCYFALFLAYYLKLAWLNIIMYLIANFIFIFSQFHVKWYGAVFHSAVLEAFMALTELFAYGIFLYFAPPDFLTEDLFSLRYLVIHGAINKTLFFAIVFFIVQIFKNRPKNRIQPDRSVFFLCLIPLTSVFIMFAFITIGDLAPFSQSTDRLIILSAVFLLLINLLVFGINQYNQRKNTEYTEMQLLLQKESDSLEYYKMLLAQNENQSILIHDIKKHLQSIDMLNEKKDHERIAAYLRQLMQSSDLKEAARLCDHEMLNAILSRYNRQCSEKHISFSADIRSGSTDFIDDADLTSLFCNLLDNAVEAAEGIPDSFIEISAGQKANTSLIVVTVVNSCRRDPFDKRTRVLVSSKSDRGNHGFGIKSIHKIVAAYHGNMQMYFDQEQSAFHTIITLKRTA